MKKSATSRVAPAFVFGVVLPLLNAGRSMAQQEPAKIPIVVAQAMAFSFLGRPQFFDGQMPPDWPAALVPPGAKVLGGGVVGNVAMYRMRAVVFEFDPGFSMRQVFEPILARAGYAQRAPEAARPRDGGFVETAPPPSPNQAYCNGSSAATFGAVDSTHAPHVVALYLIDGEAGRQMCTARQPAAGSHTFPVTVPPLAPPSGTMSVGSGSSWGGSGGDMTSSLRTTMPADSILAHYSKQLVAGGWKPEGRPAVGDGVGAQRFSFREGQDPWTGTLIVIEAGDRRDVILRVGKTE
jgi:hypothetical protein